MIIASFAGFLGSIWFAAFIGCLGFGFGWWTASRKNK